MSILAILGVIISTAAMLIVLSGFSGLKSYSLEFISSISPELKISAAKGKTFEFTPEIKSFLEKENMKYGLSYEDKALISINENNRIVRVVGLDDGFPNKNIDSIMYQGRWFNAGENEIVVGWGAAYDLGMSTMDVINPVVIYVPKAGKGQVLSEKDVMNSRRVLTSGVFSLNEELNNSLVFSDLELARDLFGLQERAVGSIDIYSKIESTEKIESFFGSDFDVENRIQQNATIYKMLNTEQFAIYLIFSLIIVVALFNVFGALMMMGVEKRKNLQTLLVLGGSKNHVGKIFFYQGLMISVSGCFIGLLIGSGLLIIQQKLSLFMITSTLAYPVIFELNNFLFVFFVVFVLGCIASALVSHYVKRSIPQISQK
ncbi:MAG: membrane protein [Bacteroidota bacterium]|nr:MAG: membrane protein [Bacteroidota bacterium]